MTEDMTENVTKEEIYAWLDETIALQEKLNYRSLGEIDLVNYLPDKAIHIFSGLKLMAKILDIDYYCGKTNDEEHPIKLWFPYKGYLVFQFDGEGKK